MWLGKVFAFVMFALLALGMANSFSSFQRTGEEVPAKVVILIYNVYDLQNMSKNLNGNYALANDIDASITRNWNNGSGFVPIGRKNAPFNGTFDGMGHRIINLWINRSTWDYLGLFGYTTENAVICDVGLVNVSVGMGWFVGGLVGYNRGTVCNSYATGKFVGGVAGGLIGVNEGTVNHSHAMGNVGIGDVVGGLVGENDGVINNSYARSDVSGHNLIGGLAGGNTGRVENSYAMGNARGDDFVGGLIGWNWGVVNNSYASGDVYGNNETGGLAGYNEGNISNSYATGNVKGDESVGGLVGENDGVINNTYAMGNVSGNEFVGGLVGWNWGRGMVKYSYATGNVRGDEYFGGLVGVGGGLFVSSFWDVNTSGVSRSDGGNGLSTSQMKNAITFLNAGWDFNRTWGIWDGQTYPFLRWQGMKSIAAAPRITGVKAGNEYVNITWNAPGEDGGLQITKYIIYCDGAKIAEVPARQLWYNDTDVKNGVTYTYYVTAVNAAGESAKSNGATAKPITVPDAPKNLTCTSGDNFVNLSWQAPAFDGGSDITEYWIYRNGTKIAEVPASHLYYNDTNVVSGVTYTYYVTAVNAAGESPKSNEVSAKPSRIQATPGNTMLIITAWVILGVVLLFMIVVTITAFWKRKS